MSDNFHKILLYGFFWVGITASLYAQESDSQKKVSPSPSPAPTNNTQWVTLDPLGGQTVWQSAVQLRQDPAYAPISGLRWRKQSADLVALPQVAGSQDLGIKAVVEGIYHRPGWSLLWKNQKIILDERKRFRLRVRLGAQSTVLKISAIGPTGEVQEQGIILFVPEWDQVLGKLDRKPANLRTFVSSVITLSTISYSEKLQGISQSVVETVLTGRISYNFFIIPPRWDVGISTYFTLMPLLKSQTSGLRFLGVNFRLGYLFPSKPGGWSLGLYGGAYYTTTFPLNGGKMGFENMKGPQLYPAMRKQLKKGTSFLTYFKASPMSSQYGFFTFTSNELAIGALYSDLLSNGHPLSFSIDISRLNFNISQIDFKGTSNTASIGVGYGF